jgi:hypothetical protein
MGFIQRIRHRFIGDQAETPRFSGDGAAGDLPSFAARTYAMQLHADPRIADADTAAYHPIRQIVERAYGFGVEHDVQLLIYHLIRQYIPTLDAAIKNRRQLEGYPHIVSKDQRLADALNDWLFDVPVGYLGGRASLSGLHVYANMMADNADEYGLSAGEIQVDEQGREIMRLVVPNVRTLSLHDENQDGLHELFQTQKGQRVRLDDNLLVQVLSFTYSAETVWPVPMAWSLLRSTEAVLRMYESVINGWWRFGDPSLLLGIEYPESEQGPQMEALALPDGTSVSFPTSVRMMKYALEGVMKGRRSGNVGDAYLYTEGGGKIVNQVLGEVDATLMRYFKEQSSVFEGHIIAHSDTPVWMYPHIEQSGDGLGSARSNNQALICATAAGRRNDRKEAVIRDVLDTHLLLSGDARYVGKYEVAFESANILDEKYEADTQKVQAEADAAIIENCFQLFPGGEAERQDENEPAGSRILTDEQRRYLEEKGVLPKL